MEGRKMPGLTRRGLVGAGLTALPMAQLPMTHAALAAVGVPVGSAVMIEDLRSDPRLKDALIRYCDIIVPMNDLKWEALRHDRAGFDYSGADETITFARRNGKGLRGHTLVWHGGLPKWAKTISSKAEAERELTNHIEQVVTRFRGIIPVWDVVNEVITNDALPEAPLRDSVWMRHLGPTYIETAFRLAAAADPAARLVINDYDLENTGARTARRRTEILRIIRNLKDKGIPVHGVGIQAHLYAEREIDVPGLQRFLAELTRLGMSVAITELDVIDWRLPADIAARDAAAAQLVATFLKAVTEVKKPESIITWGLTDRSSWISGTFKRQDGLPSRPLPLDADYKAKPMMRVLEDARRGRS
jgi:endo-1,4-beta-xylanase